MENKIKGKDIVKDEKTLESENKGGFTILGQEVKRRQINTEKRQTE